MPIDAVFQYTVQVKLKLPAPLQRLHDWGCRYEGILLLLTFMLLLRLPNLAEPYWYGDEAIYLTIGVAMRNGAILYKEIIDHKTPLIYFFAMVPGQVWFRLLNIIWMGVTTTFFFSISKKILSNRLSYLSSFAFVLFTSAPWLEGNIPNGELFVMGFILAGLWLLSKTQVFEFLQQEKIKSLEWKWSRRDLKLIGLAGVVSGLGILTKVPALLDVVALGSLLFFVAWSHTTLKNWQKTFTWFATSAGVFILGIALPILLSVVYYWARGAFADYAQFGLLYNIYYSGNWSLPFEQPWLVSLFSLPAKVLTVGLVLVLSIIWSRWKPQQTTASWIYFWVFSALFAATLSNRPYPHYLLQVIPPAALALGFMLEKKSHWITRILMVDGLSAIIMIMVLLDFGLYSSWSYYQRYMKLGTGQITPAEYRSSFDYLVSQNAQIVPQIVENTTPEDTIFVWGTNPMVYAQSQRAPATRFTVAFHIHDLKQYDQTLEEIQEAHPKYIVIMKKESPLPGLDEFLNMYYMHSAETADMILYRHTTLSSLDLLQ